MTDQLTPGEPEIATAPGVALVTGGAGFIGAHVARHLRSAGHHVVVLDDLSGGFSENVPADVTFVRGSVTDVDLVNELFRDHEFDYVFHLAAYAAEGLSHFIRRFNYTNNVIGSANIINACLNSVSVKCMVFTSSIAVYGSAEPPMKEGTVPTPEDPYGVAKYAVELDLKAAHEIFGLPYIIFRPHNVYGEMQHIGDRFRNVIGIFMNQILRGEPLKIFGSGEQTRAFTYIDAVAKPIAASINYPNSFNKVINIGGDRPYTVSDLAARVADAMGVEPVIDFLEARKEVLHAFSDHEVAKEIFGDLCIDIGLTEGLERMARWARRAGERKPSSYEGIEVEKNMPPSWRGYTR
jgi:UDP-glucose 4-epimerase